MFSLSFVFLFFTGALMSLALLLISPYLAREVLGDTRAYYSLMAVAPAVFVISVTSAFRGYFQGCRLMWPTAISEVVEQVIRVATVLTAAWILIPRGVEYAAAGAAFGTCTGGCASLLFLLLVLMFIKRREVQTDRQPLQLGEKIKILKKLILYAFPISAGSLVLPLAQVIDTVIIPSAYRR